MVEHQGIYKEGDIVYLYPNLQPSVVPPVLFICLFSIILIVKILDLINFFKKQGSKFVYQSSKQESIEFKNYRTTVIKTCIPFILGITSEVFGYLFFLISMKNPHTLSIFIISQVLILISPSVITYSIYLVFNDLQSYFSANDYILIKTSYFAMIMIIVDCFLIALELTGSFLMIQTATVTFGFGVAISFYFIEISLFILFVGITIRFLFLINKTPTELSYSIDHNLLGREHNPPKWRKLIWLLLSSMLFVIIRSILRLAKFVSDVEGLGSFSQEAVYYLIETVPTFISCLFLIIARPEYVLWEISSFVHWNKRKEMNRLDHGDLNYDFITYDVYTR